MYSFKVKEYIELKNQFEAECRDTVHKIAEYDPRFRDIWFSIDISEDGETVEVSYYRQVNNGETIEEDVLEFPVSLLWATDSEIKEWAEQPLEDLSLEEAITMLSDRVEVEDDVYAAHLFEQLSDWLKELREVKQKQL